MVCWRRRKQIVHHPLFPQNSNSISVLTDCLFESSLNVPTFSSVFNGCLSASEAPAARARRRPLKLWQRDVRFACQSVCYISVLFSVHPPRSPLPRSDFGSQLVGMLCATLSAQMKVCSPEVVGKLCATPSARLKVCSPRGDLRESLHLHFFLTRS